MRCFVMWFNITNTGIKIDTQKKVGTQHKHHIWRVFTLSLLARRKNVNSPLRMCSRNYLLHILFL